MSCTLCIKHKKSNALTGDCRNIKTSTFTRHADSKDHKAVAAESMACSFEKTVKKVLDEKEAALVSALKVVFWMTIKDIEFLQRE